MTATTIRVQMAQRKDTAANWTAANPILLSGEIGYETDTKKFKIGNGSTNWNSLAYLPIPDGSGNLTITGNLEIGSTGSLTFEGSTADGFETTLAVTNPTADRTITLPNQSGSVLVSGNASIVDADISATAEIAVSKLADGTARQLLQTDAAGTGVEWASNIDIPGTLDVTGAATFDAAVNIVGAGTAGSTQAVSFNGSAPVNSLVLTSGGLVGIGTASPAGKCVVRVSNNTGAPIAWNSNFLVVSNGDASTSSGIGFSVDTSDSSTSISALTPGTTWLKQYYRGISHTFWYGDAGVTQGMTLDSSGRLLVGFSSDSGGALLQVNGNRIRVGTAKTPASATDTGTAGEICWDASYIYVCTATNTWKRTAIATW